MPARKKRTSKKTVSRKTVTESDPARKKTVRRTATAGRHSEVEHRPHDELELIRLGLFDDVATEGRRLELIEGLTAVFGAGDFLPSAADVSEAVRAYMDLIEAVAEWDLDATADLPPGYDAVEALEDMVLGLERQQIAVFSNGATRFRRILELVNRTVIPNFNMVSTSFVKIGAQLRFGMPFFPLIGVASVLRLLPKQILDDAAAKKLIEDIKKLIQEITKDNKINGSDKAKLKELKGKLEKLQERIEAKEAAEAKKQEKQRKANVIKGLKRIIGLVEELISEGLTGGLLDSPDLKEIKWGFDKKNSRWCIDVDVNETFSMELVRDFWLFGVDLDIKCDCKIYVKQRKDGCIEVTVNRDKCLFIDVHAPLVGIAVYVPPDFFVR
ncbi:hypothetical protein JYU02_01480, partial [bacterium AH-315-P15]|nr:hypothetical protein [bacterium AH-315-P15]